jgi:hypothetical protein
MQKISISLIVCAGLLSGVAFAQSAPQPPASWVEFKKQEEAKRADFLKQMRQEREAFLSTHPEVKSYFDQVRALRLAQGRTLRHRPNGLLPQ